MNRASDYKYYQKYFNLNDDLIILLKRNLYLCEFI